MLETTQKFLFREIDNSTLVVFRILFGIIIFLETAGSIAIGHVHEVYIEPDIPITFMGFEWLGVLAGSGMYVYFGIMALLGILISLGYRYRVSMGLWTLMWAASYLMQKTHYNNHHYLMVIMGGMMTLLPAHRYLSLDAKRDPSIKKLTCPAWCYWVFIIQLWIVYTWAGIVKFYPGWLDGSFVSQLFESRKHFYLVGPILQESWFHSMIIYGGIAFDLLVVPMLLWKRTRMLALGLSFFFHIFNSTILHIGIFPYLMLATDLFFFPPEKIRALFLRKKPQVEAIEWKPPLKTHQSYVMMGLGIFFLIQILLPIRPYLIEGNVFWTEEGHRLSWRMMLRAKYGTLNFRIVKEDGTEETLNPRKMLTRRQYNAMAAKPDMIWQFAQYLKQDYLNKGEKVKIYASSLASLNGSPYMRLIDPEVDLAEVEWKWFGHNPWILSYPLNQTYEK